MQTYCCVCALQGRACQIYAGFTITYESLGVMLAVFESPAVFLTRIRYNHRDKAAYKTKCHYKLICWLASAQNIVKQKNYFVKRGFV